MYLFFKKKGDKWIFPLIVPLKGSVLYENFSMLFYTKFAEINDNAP